MKRILILGAGTAGTMMANHLNRAVNRKEWNITVVDMSPVHYYQPGFLFVPFGRYTEKDLVRDTSSLLPKSIEYLSESIERIDADHNRVELRNGIILEYHLLIIATGSRIEPGEIDGLMNGGWRRNIFDFYTMDGAAALEEKLRDWPGGHLVIHLAEMPIKCPVAPLEFTFLTDWFLHRRKIRDEVKLTYVTPLSEAFTKHNCSVVLNYMLEEKQIDLVTDFAVERVDAENNKIHGYGDKTVDYDLLVTVPTHMGDPVIERSGLGDDLRFIPTHPHTLQSKEHENVFVIGDATDLPSSKAGSVAHFQAEVLTDNILHFIKNEPLDEGFDGHANCFIESGFGKAFLIDFNYDIEPVQGTFPIPGLGPFSLLKETRINHLGKLAFRWVYWNLLLKGYRLPGISTQLQLAGKKLPS